MSSSKSIAKRFGDEQLRYLMKRVREDASNDVIAAELNVLQGPSIVKPSVDFTSKDVDTMRGALKMPPFSEEHTDYIIERHEKENLVLATELNSLFDTGFNAEDVAKKRAELKLPPPNHERALEKVSLDFSRRKNESAAKDSVSMTTPKIKTEQPAPQAQKNFAAAVDPVQSRLDALKSQKRENSDFVFKPTFIMEAKEGKTYVYPGVGPVICQGVSEMTAAGQSMKIISFVEKYPANGNPKTVRFDPALMEKKNVRELATPEQLDQALHKLVHGETTLKKIPSVPKYRKTYYEGISASPDLAEVTDLLCLTAKNSKSLRDVNTLDNQFGNICIQMIATEYSEVKKIPIAEAQSLVKRAVGVPTLDQLSRYNDGRPNANGPK
jgi:RNA polymerase-interacting CarD/CdnL/TRCF family regulator